MSVYMGIIYCMASAIIHDWFAFSASSVSWSDAAVMGMSDLVMKSWHAFTRWAASHPGPQEATIWVVQRVQVNLNGRHMPCSRETKQFTLPQFVQVELNYSHTLFAHWSQTSSPSRLGHEKVAPCFRWELAIWMTWMKSPTVAIENDDSTNIVRLQWAVPRTLACVVQYGNVLAERLTYYCLWVCIKSVILL